MKKGIVKYMIYCILGSFVLTIFFCYIAAKENKEDYTYIAGLTLMLGPVSVVILIFVNIICIIIDGMTKVKKFKGNQVFVEIEKYRTFSKNDDKYYVEMVSIINRAYKSKQFTRIMEESKITDLLTRKEYLEQNIDFNKTPITFMDTILYFIFTTFLGLFFKVSNSSGWLILGAMVLLGILEIFILFYKYSDFMELNNTECEIYKHELRLIEKAIHKINKSKCNKKQSDMYLLKMVIHNRLKDLKKSTKIFKKKKINNDIDSIKNLNVCENLKNKNNYYIVKIEGEEYKLYYSINNIATSKDNPDSSDIDNITDTIINIIERNKIGNIQKKTENDDTK